MCAIKEAKRSHAEPKKASAVKTQAYRRVLLPRRRLQPSGKLCCSSERRVSWDKAKADLEEVRRELRPIGPTKLRHGSAPRETLLVTESPGTEEKQRTGARLSRLVTAVRSALHAEVAHAGSACAGRGGDTSAAGVYSAPGDVPGV